ncbi:GIY-YIG nuclease family protein [Flavobacterium stagni]|uniref:GIY-YIG nuclease family protein n=1 Tax=Flavobacterium stagni TaxID=2506421 RepID=A0A4Q1K7X7_9FLAO|nr:GIY-YIG nuclease family protein [Flavobacterium stagni]RXR22289.1 GIY-YIG nuclease family protein [Flavobacterium stagni]
MTTLYILHSKKLDRFYVGETHHLDTRLERHNAHTYSKNFTKIADDWTVVLAFEHPSRTTILRLERFIKNMKSKAFIKKIIDNPSLLNAIIDNKGF